MTTFDDIFESQEFEKDYKDRLINLSAESPSVNFLFKCNDTEFLPCGDILVIKGKPKAGKSHAIIYMITALLTGKFADLQSNESNLKILYIDCEMNESNTVDMTRKVHRLCDFDLESNHPQFKVLNLRSDNPRDREQMTEQAIKDERPNVIFIDGIVDLITTEINDQREANRIIQTLIQWTKKYNITIVTVLHENKKDNYLRGAIGTELHNKCAEVWEITKENGLFTMTQVDSRNKPSNGFTFNLNENGEPSGICMSPKKNKPKTREELLSLIFQQCLSNGPLRYKDLINQYSAIKECKEGAAQNAISDATKMGIIIHENNLYAFNPTSPYNSVN